MQNSEVDLIVYIWKGLRTDWTEVGMRKALNDPAIRAQDFRTVALAAVVCATDARAEAPGWFVTDRRCWEAARRALADPATGSRPIPPKPEELCGDCQRGPHSPDPLCAAYTPRPHRPASPVVVAASAQAARKAIHSHRDRSTT